MSTKRLILPIIKIELLFVFLIVMITNIKSIAQYKSIEINATQSLYHDDNIDGEYSYTSYWIQPLVTYNLAYSFPLSSNFLLNSTIGTTWSSSDYYQNPVGPPFSIGDITIHKSTQVRYINIGFSTSYWLKTNYTGWFFIGGIRGHLITQARSETFIRTYNDIDRKFEEEPVINSTFKEEMQSIVPIVSIGAGYNLRIYRGLHLFANLNIDYRPTGYYKNTRNITHINRRLTMGIKYAFNRIQKTEHEIE